MTVIVSTDDRSGAGPMPGVGSSGPRRGAPVTILQVYAVLLILIPPTQIIGPLGAVGTPATVVGLGALLLWGIGVLAPGDHLRRTVLPVRVVLGLLVGTILLGYTVLHFRFVPLDELLSSDRMLLQVLSWAGVALLAAEGLGDRGELYRVMRAVTAAVAVMAVVGVLQFRFGTDLAELTKQIPGLQQNADLVSIQDREGFRRPAGTATHPIEFGCVIAMALPLALHLARFDVARSRFRRWLPVVAIAMGVPVALSRSAVLGAVVVTAVVIMGLDAKLRPRALGAVAAFVLVLYATTPGLLGTLRNLFVHANSDTSVTLRTSDYEVVAEYVRQSPLIGRGPGTFLPANYLFLDNQYLLSAVEIGLVGLVVVIAYLLAAAFLGRGARHRTKDPAIRDLGQAMAAMSVGAAVTAFTFDAFSFMMYAGFVPLGLGAAGALWAMTRTAQRRIEAGARLDGRSEDRLRLPLPALLPPTPAGDLREEATRDRIFDHSPSPISLTAQPPSRATPDPHRVDVGHANHESGADDNFDWLTTIETDPSGILADSRTGPPGSHPTGGREDDGDEGDVGGERAGRVTGRPFGKLTDSRRMAAAVGAGLGAVLVGVLALVVGRGSSDEPNLIVAPKITTTTTGTPTTRSTTAATTRESGTTVRPRTTTAARPPSAPLTRPLRGDTTAETISRPTSASSPSPPPTRSPTGGPTATTTPATVEPPPPTTTTTAAPPTTTTTAAPPTTTTTTAPPTGP